MFESLAAGGVFAPAAQTGDPDFLVAVGLIHMVAPQWSGRVTLETSWAVTLAATGEEIARQSIEATTLAPFAGKREATQTAAKMNIEEGLVWLELVVKTHSAT